MRLAPPLSRLAWGLALFALGASPVFSAATNSEANQLKKKILKNKKGLEQIQQKLNEEKKKQQQAKLQEKSVLNQLQKVDQNLGRLEREKQANSEDLEETRYRLDRLQVDMEGNQQHAQQSKELLKRRLRALYRMSFRTPFLGGILESGDSSDLTRKLKFSMLLAESNEKLLEETLRRERELEEANRELDKEKARKRRIQDALGRQESRYATEKTNRTHFLTSLRREQVLRDQTIADLNEASVELHQKVDALLEQSSRLEKQTPTLVKGPGLLVKRGKIPWPVSGRIISPFGKYKNPEFKVVVENSGVQIQAPLGTPFKAVASGTVRYADWFKGYGKLVILDHGQGYYSLYAQASELSVSEGQQVAAGQVLGSVGDTGSLVGSSLYFEIRKNGVPQDPLRWLRSKS